MHELLTASKKNEIGRRAGSQGSNCATLEDFKIDKTRCYVVCKGQQTSLSVQEGFGRALHPLAWGECRLIRCEAASPFQKDM